MYLVTAKEMQAMDKRAIETAGIPGRVLMENAGRGATRFFRETFSDMPRKKVGIIAGRGNNGGDGFVIARYLIEDGTDVTVYLLSTADKVKGDAGANLNLLKKIGAPVVEMPDKKSFEKTKTSIHHQNLIIDAIFGTGLHSDVKGYHRDVIDFINALDKPVFSVDIPSGINSDTGQPCGTCIQAEATATFAFAKTGHFLYPGAGYTGRLEIIDIGIPDHIAASVNPKQFLITEELIKTYIRPRDLDAHKGETGHLLIVAGSPGKTGAAALSAMSAMRTGTGLVTLGVPKSLNPVIEPMVLEVMTCPLPETKDGIFSETALIEIKKLLSDKKCLAIGPGIGTASSTRKLVQKLILESTVPVVVDADGLNCLSGDTDVLRAAKTPVILTPHPGEMARLTGSTSKGVQKDRVACARGFAEKFNVHIVLKGAGTVIAHPDGTVFINPTGNPGMASGGMGDVLTGMIAGLITQGYSTESAAHAGVFLHGAAADEMAGYIGPVGYLASDVMLAIPEQIGRILGHD